MTTDYVFQNSLGLPGINRDQTPFQTKNWVDGVNVRWYNNEPRKMGGYYTFDQGDNEIVYSLFGEITDRQVNLSGVSLYTINLYQGRGSSLSYFLMDDNGAHDPSVDITPPGFVADTNNLWTFDQYSQRDPNNLNVQNFILAMVAPTLGDISSVEPGITYYGNGEKGIAFTPVQYVDNITFAPIGPVNLNGFVLVASPLIFIGGQEGLIYWNDVRFPDGNPLNFPTSNFFPVSNTRLVVGKQIRGGNTISILIWSLNGLYRLTLVPGSPATAAVFVKENISEQVSILSQNCVVEVPSSSTYYWIGKKCFYQYNGVASELINTFNKQYFFDNITPGFEEKCWTEFRADFNEVWFHAPMFLSTECNHAVIYNIQLKCWYDTISNRAAGIPANFLSYPVQSDSSLFDPSKGSNGITYRLWLEEFGDNNLIDENKKAFAIQSYCRTHDRMLASMAPNQDFQTRSRRFEPDIKLVGQMTLQIYNKKFPSSEYQLSKIYNLRDPITGEIGKVDLYGMGRIVSYYFESNEVNGFYQFGRSIIDLAVDPSERPSS